MSGIAGIIRFDRGPVDPAHIRSMAAALSHLGPNGQGEWVKGSVGLAHLALHTTAESLDERQPLANEDESLVLVMDGWLSNWEELRQELLGHGVRLRDPSDTELVLRAYEKWGGERFLHHLEGDFSFVLWDARQQRAFCVRDRVGNKPLYYRWDGTTFVFASELHAILGLPGVPAVLDAGTAAEFIAAEWHSREATLWQGISRLVAAHRLLVGASGLSKHLYWEPDPSFDPGCRSDGDYIEHYRGLLDDTVRRASRSHLPLACDVSGGLDSSAVFATAEQLRRAGRLLAPDLAGYTLAVEGDPEVDDLAFARAVAQHLGVTVREVPPFEPSFDWYRHSAAFYRNVPGYPNGVLQFLVYRASREAGSRVHVTGLGGDEWLAGGRFALAEEMAARRWRHLVGLWKEDGDAYGAAPALTRMLRSGLLPLIPERYRRADRVLRTAFGPHRSEPRDWMAPDLVEALIRRRGPQASAKPTRLGQSDLTNFLTGPLGALVRELMGRLAAGVGVELRHPLWSARLVEFAYAVPDRLRLRGRRDRVFHRAAIADRLPRTVTERSTKSSFSGLAIKVLLPLRDTVVSRVVTQRPDWVTPTGLGVLWEELSRPATFTHAYWPLWGLLSVAAVAGSPKPDETV